MRVFFFAVLALVASLSSARADCPYQRLASLTEAVLNDGCFDAPFGEPQAPHLLERYLDRRSPWDVPGVDYYVGHPQNIALKSWETIPTTHLTVVTGQGGSVTCADSTPMNLDGYDFTINGGIGSISAPASTCTSISITNSKFGCATTGPSGAQNGSTLINVAENVPVTIRSVTFNYQGCETNAVGAGGSAALLKMSAGGSLTFQYNYVTHTAGQVVVLSSPISAVNMQYNFFDNPTYDIAASLTTNATTATSSNVLHFASVPSSVTVGGTVYDTTNSAHILGGTTVIAKTSTSVTISANPLSSIANGEAFNFTVGTAMAVHTVSGSTITSDLVQFNTVNLSATNNMTGGQAFRFDCGTSCTITNPSYDHNTIVSLCCATNLLHGTSLQPNAGATISGTATNSTNYYDPTGTGDTVSLAGLNTYAYQSMIGWTSSSNVDMRNGATIVTGLNKPGPSINIFYNNPYYTCTTNRYVAANGLSINNGTSPTSPWDIDTARQQALSAGTCLNFAAGAYNLNSLAPISISHGGTSASRTGYVVWRCAVMPFSFSNGSLQGEGSGCVMSNTNSANFYIFQIQSNTSYMIFDGFEFNGGSFATGVCFDNENNNASAHHIWLMNSDVYGCGQSGIQFSVADWQFEFHNVWHDNAGSNCVMGSGFSSYQPVTLNSYTPTAGNTDYWHSSTTGRTYNSVLAWNVGYRNYNPPGNTAPACTLCGGFPGGCNTDGEGIILDDWGHTQSACPSGSGFTCPYTGHTLVMGNIMWGNGGEGIETFSFTTGQTAHIDVVNNTTYSNGWDPNTQNFGLTGGNGSWHAQLYAAQALNSTFWNNIGVTVNIGSADNCSINGSGGANQTACTITDQLSLSVNSDQWQTNMSFAGSFLNVDSNATYSTGGANHNTDGTDPRLSSLNPITSTSGTNVSNFALCTATNKPVNGCAGASPAIGFGQTFDLWPLSTNDAGACSSALGVCP